MQSVVPYPEVETPALVIDMDIVDSNIAEMAELARVADMRLRPHTKTHRMPALAMRQLAAGASGITCSSLGDAELMAEMVSTCDPRPLLHGDRVRGPNLKVSATHGPVAIT